MIQNYLADSLVKNYTAPSYPIYISLQNSINLINIKKSIKDSKSDIIFVNLTFNIVGRKSWLRSLRVRVD